VNDTDSKAASTTSDVARRLAEAEAERDRLRADLARLREAAKALRARYAALAARGETPDASVSLPGARDMDDLLARHDALAVVAARKTDEAAVLKGALAQRDQRLAALGDELARLKNAASPAASPAAPAASHLGRLLDDLADENASDDASYWRREWDRAESERLALALALSQSEVVAKKLRDQLASAILALGRADGEAARLADVVKDAEAAIAVREREIAVLKRRLSEIGLV